MPVSLCDNPHSGLHPCPRDGFRHASLSQPLLAPRHHYHTAVVIPIRGCGTGKTCQVGVEDRCGTSIHSHIPPAKIYPVDTLNGDEHRIRARAESDIGQGELCASMRRRCVGWVRFVGMVLRSMEPRGRSTGRAETALSAQTERCLWPVYPWTQDNHPRLSFPCAPSDLLLSSHRINSFSSPPFHRHPSPCQSPVGLC